MLRHRVATTLPLAEAIVTVGEGPRLLVPHSFLNQRGTLAIALGMSPNPRPIEPPLLVAYPFKSPKLKLERNGL